MDMGQTGTDGQTDGQQLRLMPPLWWPGMHNSAELCEADGLHIVAETKTALRMRVFRDVIVG